MEMRTLYEVSLEYKCIVRISVLAGSRTEARKLAMIDSEIIFGRHSFDMADHAELELTDPAVAKIRKWDEKYTRMYFGEAG